MQTGQRRFLDIGKLLVMIALVFAAIGCGKQEKPQPTEKLTAFVTIAPQEYVVERIGGDLVEAETLVPAGQSPHTYEPTPQQIAQLEQADVYFRIGLAIENRIMDRVAGMIGTEHVVDTRLGVPLREIEGHHHEGEEATEEHSEGGGAADPHIWLDPVLMKTQAQTVANALMQLHPERRDQLAANLAAFQHDLDSVDAQIHLILDPLQGRAMYVFHPAYGYFADRYGLRQVAIESGGKEPSARELTELIDRARADSVTSVFVQRQFARKTAQAVADAIGANVVVLDHLSDDYLNNLLHMARLIASGLTQGEE